jgi:hypothetical protein
VIGQVSMKSFVSMKSRLCFAALSVAAFLFTSLSATAQTPSEDSTDGAIGGAIGTDSAEATASLSAENEESTEPAAPATSEESTEPEAPAEKEESTEPAAPTEREESTQPTAPTPEMEFAQPVDPMRFENSTMSLRLGLIAQPQFEAVGAPDAEKTTKNLFLRRAGLIVSGTVLESFDFFFDVDYPNLFKVDPTNQTGGTGKNSPGLNVQDVIVTFKPAGKLLKIDAGFMLPPLSHNALQGAATLYGWDYFVNSFRRNVLSSLDPFSSIGQSPAGRDAGFQLRGLLLNDHIEYRAGLFQGLRVGPLPAAQGTEAEVGGVNFFRVSARLQFNVLDAEPDFFYQGTYLGTKKILSFGAFYDFQDQYKSMGGDLLLDLPVGPGIITAQANVVLWDGGNFIQTLPKHTAIMAEAGYLFKPLMLSPIARFERLISDELTAALPSEDRYGGGLAFWPFGHNANLKAFFTRVHRVPAPQDFNQVNVQWQLFF